MLIDARQSALLVVDVQERLLPAIDDWQRTLDAVIWLIQVARRLDVPLLVSEQYPKGLGHTHADVLAVLPAGVVVEKVHFSCLPDACLPPLVGSDRQQVVVCGTEAHVCVLQTAIDLKLSGKDVFVVADAIGSRTPESKHLALERMRQHGIEIVSREMVAFEWLRVAGTPLFREISCDYLR
jgi:nicotinamidase-related amidase